jgi:hypothetical protein
VASPLLTPLKSASRGSKWGRLLSGRALSDAATNSAGSAAGSTEAVRISSAVFIPSSDIRVSVGPAGTPSACVSSASHSGGTSRTKRRFGISTCLLSSVLSCCGVMENRFSNCASCMGSHQIKHESEEQNVNLLLLLHYTCSTAAITARNLFSIRYLRSSPEP